MDDDDDDGEDDDEDDDNDDLILSPDIVEVDQPVPPLKCRQLWSWNPHMMIIDQNGIHEDYDNSDYNEHILMKMTWI